MLLMILLLASESNLLFDSEMDDVCIVALDERRGILNLYWFVCVCVFAQETL